MENGIATLIASIITGIGTIVFFVVQKRFNAKKDKQDILETSSNTIKSLLESIDMVDDRYKELSKEIDDFKAKSEKQLEEEREKRRELAEELGKEKLRLNKEIQSIKDAFKEERRKLLAVIVDLIKQMKDAGITPDTTLLDATGVSIGIKNNKI